MHEQPTSETDASVKMRTDGPVSRTDLILLWFTALASTVAWIPLYRWYGLLENEHNTHFAFEKIPGWFDSPIMRQTLALFVLIGLLYGFALWLLSNLSAISRNVMLAIGLLIAGPAIVNVLLYPVGALDVFNYMIELKLAFFYEQNPYLVTFKEYRSDPFALPAFLVDIKLFYGPAWLAFSWLPTAITGFDDVLTTLIGLKLFNLLLLMVTTALIAGYHRQRLTAVVAATLFLANPLVLFEGVANVHNDVLMTALLIGAFYALKQRSPVAGALLVLSALVKFNPLVLAPLMIAVMLRERWEPRKLLLTATLAVAAAVAVALPWWEGGEFISGVTGGLEQSQRMDHVSISSLARQWFQNREAEGATPSMAAHIHGRVSFDIVSEQIRDRLNLGFTVIIVLFTTLIALAVWKGAPVEPAAAATLLVLILFGTNFYPWYLIPVFSLLALRIDRTALAYVTIASTAALAYYPLYVYAHFSTNWTRYDVHRFLAIFLTIPAVLFLIFLFRLIFDSKSDQREKARATSATS